MKAPLPKVKTRKVKLAWQHFNQETEPYVMVCESTGGGQREMSISVSADYIEILNLLIDLFFPNENVPEVHHMKWSFTSETLAVKLFLKTALP